MSSPSAEQSRAAIKAADMGHLGERMGIEWLEVGAERTVARMPVPETPSPMASSTVAPARCSRSRLGRWPLSWRLGRADSAWESSCPVATIAAHVMGT